MAEENYIKIVKETEGYSLNIGGQKYNIKAKNIDKSSLFNPDRSRAQDVKNDSNIFGNRYIAEPSSTYVAPKHLPIDSLNMNRLEKDFTTGAAKKKKEVDIKEVEEFSKYVLEKRGIEPSTKDLPYWSEKIKNLAETYSFPYEILVSIIGRESKFTKNVSNGLGAGPMGITTISVKAFFPNVKDSWNNIYKQMNEPLLNDILYKKDSDGNFIKDKNGNFILKYKTPEALRNACGKDDELGMKVGMLTFQMKYICAVGLSSFKGRDWQVAPKAIEGIKNGTLKVSEAKNKNYIISALTSYNSVFKTYGKDVISYLTNKGVKLDKDFLFDSFPKEELK